MNVAEFEDHFHRLHSIYSDKSNEMGAKLKEKYEKERRELSEQLDDELFDEIGKLFQTMDLEDKIDFLERYVARHKLAKYVEPHEMTALRIMEWPYLVYLERQENDRTLGN